MKTRKKISAKLLAIMLIAALLLPLAWNVPVEAAEAKQIDVLFSHDTHSHLNSFSTIIDGEQKEVDGFRGHPGASVSRGVRHDLLVHLFTAQGNACCRNAGSDPARGIDGAVRAASCSPECDLGKEKRAVCRPRGSCTRRRRKQNKRGCADRPRRSGTSDPLCGRQIPDRHIRPCTDHTDDTIYLRGNTCIRRF